MKIVINGGGGVGRALSGILSEEQHDVTVIEPRASQVEALRDTVDCSVLLGSGSSPASLREAGTDEADVFIAVTDRDEVNLLSCTLARNLGCPRSVARVREPSFASDPQALPIDRYGIDQIINPDQQAAAEILRLLENPGATQIVPLADGTVVAAGMLVAEDSSFSGRRLAELPTIDGQDRYRVAVIRRDNEAIIPAGRDRILAGDEIFVIAEPETVRRLARLVNPNCPRQEVGRLMILGASDLGRSVAEMLQGRCRVKMVDTGGWATASAAETLHRTLVIEGEGHDMDLLAREGLDRMDAFVAVTDAEETNLIACLYAKRLGVGRAIARVEREFYRPLTMTLGVDAAVSARQVTVNAILRYIRYGDIRAAARLRGVAAEALELSPRPGSKVLGRPLRDVRFPRGVLVGVLVRPGEVVIPTGDTVIQPGDNVIVFTLHESVRSVEKLFT
jgi:trk system potassium uptake protein TrkA